jgi:predicted metal-dependent hydrolase
MEIKINNIVRSKRKTIALIIEENAEITVRAPLKVSNKEITDFVSKHTGWIESKLVKVREKIADKAERDGKSILFRGRDLEIEYNLGTDYAVKIGESKLFLDESLRGNEKANIALLFKRNAKTYFVRRTVELARQFGFSPNSIRQSSARLKWGSCNYRKKSINLNWRLIMAPLEVSDYVIIHELCHLKHPNHSANFWSLVEKYCPDWKAHKKWLADYGRLLDV